MLWDTISELENSMQQIQGISLAGPGEGEGRTDGVSTWFWKFQLTEKRKANIPGGGWNAASFSFPLVLHFSL